jgi:hypothetical protein
VNRQYQERRVRLRASAWAKARKGLLVVHHGDCGCLPHQFFQCADCLRLVGYCQGGHEDNERLDGLCCDCWVKATRACEVAP